MRSSASPKQSHDLFVLVIALGGTRRIDRRSIDCHKGEAFARLNFRSWQSLLATILGLTLVTLLGLGIRLLTQMTFQQRRERMNRQINERLKTLIAAYKVLGGSFTGDLTVDPAHMRDLRRRDQSELATRADGRLDYSAVGASRSDRTRRIRDAVEAALSDIILLGTEEHVRLADRAVQELVAGNPVHTHELVVSIRAFVRDALDLDPIPSDLTIATQGPARASSSSRRDGGSNENGGRNGGGERLGDGGGGLGGGGLGSYATCDNHHRARHSITSDKLCTAVAVVDGDPVDDVPRRPGAPRNRTFVMFPLPLPGRYHTACLSAKARQLLHVPGCRNSNPNFASGVRGSRNWRASVENWLWRWR